jgi:serine/threonine protein kinase
MSNLEPEEERRLVADAVARRWLTEDQGRQALEICAKASELGLGASLEEVLTKKGWLTAERWKELRGTSRSATLTIGRYSVLEKAGEGGMGSIFKVKKPGSKEVYALKLLSREVSKLKDWRARFQREAKVAVTLDHPNVVRGIEYGQEKDRYYYVMEYIEGTNLADLIHDQGPVAEPRAVEWMIQIADGLDYIHARKLIHRDIKPDNLIVTPQGIARLTDLGLAKSVADNSPQITATGTAVGTPGYMSPEQIRGEKNVDIRTDIYSLGATFYYAMTGRKPFEGDSFQEVLVKHLNETLASPKAHTPRLSDGVCRVIEKMMAKERKDRYRDPADLLKDLKSLQKGQPLVTREIKVGLSMVSRTLTEPTVELKRRSKDFPWGAVLGLLGLASAGAALLWWFVWRR